MYKSKLSLQYLATTTHALNHSINTSSLKLLVMLPHTLPKRILPDKAPHLPYPPHPTGPNLPSVDLNHSASFPIQFVQPLRQITTTSAIIQIYPNPDPQPRTSHTMRTSHYTNPTLNPTGLPNLPGLIPPSPCPPTLTLKHKKVSALSPSTPSSSSPLIR